MSDAHLHSLLLLENPFAFRSFSHINSSSSASHSHHHLLDCVRDRAHARAHKTANDFVRLNLFIYFYFRRLFDICLCVCVCLMCIPLHTALERAFFLFSDLIFFLAYLLIIMTGEMITLYGHKRTKGICVYWCCNCAVSRVYCIAFACCSLATISQLCVAVFIVCVCYYCCYSM